MREFFAGRNAELLTEEMKIPGVRVWHMELEEREFGHMACRMEEAFTFIYVLRGEMCCQVNQEKTEIKAGEGLFVNSLNAYRFLSCTKEGCEFYVAVFDKEYLKTDTDTAQKYVESIAGEETISGVPLNREKKTGRKILDCISDMGAALKEKEAGYELEIKGLALCMWTNLYRAVRAVNEAPKKAELREKAKLNKMLEFLHVHYKEKITLGGMAEACGVSTGEYCRFFKKRMEQTPFEYLQVYRIEKSLPEVLEKSDSITNIALKHGFTGSSYYAETFKKEMGCAPGDYRKWFRGEADGECPLKLNREEDRMDTKAAEAPVGKPAEKQSAKPEEQPAPVRRQSMPTHLL